MYKSTSTKSQVRSLISTTFIIIYIITNLGYMLLKQKVQ